MIGNVAMLVFWEQRLVVLSTPKTASTALATALESLAVVALMRPPVLKHTTVHRYRRFIGPYLEGASGAPFTVVALMREPQDWLGSWYRYRRRPETKPGNSTVDVDFDAFVRAYCADIQPACAAVGSQGRFLRPRHGKGVDRLFRYEEMPAFTSFLAERLGHPVTLPRLNVSPHADLILTADTRSLFTARYAEDFTLYASIGNG